jgi:hypothetical protein
MFKASSKMMAAASVGAARDTKKLGGFWQHTVYVPKPALLHLGRKFVWSTDGQKRTCLGPLSWFGLGRFLQKASSPVQREFSPSHAPRTSTIVANLLLSASARRRSEVLSLFRRAGDLEGGAKIFVRPNPKRFPIEELHFLPLRPKLRNPALIRPKTSAFHEPRHPLSG